MYVKRRLWLPVLLATLPPTAAAAQDAAPPQDALIVVTGSRAGERDAAQTTVTEADIAHLQAPTLLDALNNVAGVRAVSTGGVGGGSFVSIRGGEPNFTLVMIDGVRVNDTTNGEGGAFDFTLVDPSLVEGVDVHRGATSAVQGSDALSGVINIRLRDPMIGGTVRAARLTIGTDGELGGGVTAIEGWHNGGLLIGGSGYASRGSDPYSTLDRRQGVAEVRQRVADYDLTGLALYAHSRHSEFPLDSGGPDFAINRSRETGTGNIWLAALALRRRQDSGPIRPNLSVSWSSQTNENETPAIAPGVLSGVPAITARSLLHRLEAIGDVTVDLSGLTVSIGAVLLEEHARSIGSIDYGFPVPSNFRLSRRTVSGFAEATWNPLPEVSINVAGRYDAVRSGPGTWTSRAGFSWQPLAKGPSLFARIDQGLKLPSFYALGNPLVGDPALRPERSSNHEAGARWALGALTARVAWFDDRFSNLIDFDPALFRLVNRSHVTARGIEAEGSWHLSNVLQLTAALTRLTLESATPLLNRPRWEGNARAVWQVSDRIAVNAAARFNGNFLDSSVPTGNVVTNGHIEADVGLEWKVARRLKVSGTLRNVSGSRSYLAVGYPQMGRRLLTTISLAGL